jgi:hypothetical protein
MILPGAYLTGSSLQWPRTSNAGTEHQIRDTVNIPDNVRASMLTVQAAGQVRPSLT